MALGRELVAQGIVPSRHLERLTVEGMAAPPTPRHLFLKDDLSFNLNFFRSVS